MPVPSHQTVRLSRGRHSSPESGACVMELASMPAGEPFSDHPRCASRTVAAFLRCYNDSLNDKRRRQLYVYAAKGRGERRFAGSGVCPRQATGAVGARKTTATHALVSPGAIQAPCRAAPARQPGIRRPLRDPHDSQGLGRNPCERPCADRRADRIWTVNRPHPHGTGRLSRSRPIPSLRSHTPEGAMRASGYLASRLRGSCLQWAAKPTTTARSWVRVASSVRRLCSSKRSWARST